MAKQRQVLVIDDEADFLELMKVRLESSGYAVEVASTGRLGLEAAQRCSPALILLDINMPEMDGFQVLKALRRDPATRRVPVVMLTAKGDTKSIFKAEELGMSEYVIKPCESAKLLEVVRKNIAPY